MPDPKMNVLGTAAAPKPLPPPKPIAPPTPPPALKPPPSNLLSKVPPMAPLGPGALHAGVAALGNKIAPYAGGLMPKIDSLLGRTPDAAPSRILARAGPTARPSNILANATPAPSNILANATPDSAPSRMLARATPAAPPSSQLLSKTAPVSQATAPPPRQRREPQWGSPGPLMNSLLGTKTDSFTPSWLSSLLGTKTDSATPSGLAAPPSGAKLPFHVDNPASAANHAAAVAGPPKPPATTAPSRMLAREEPTAPAPDCRQSPCGSAVSTQVVRS